MSVSTNDDENLEKSSERNLLSKNTSDRTNNTKNYYETSLINNSFDKVFKIFHEKLRVSLKMFYLGVKDKQKLQEKIKELGCIYKNNRKKKYFSRLKKAKNSKSKENAFKLFDLLSKIAKKKGLKCILSYNKPRKNYFKINNTFTRYYLYCLADAFM